MQTVKPYARFFTREALWMLYIPHDPMFGCIFADTLDEALRLFNAVFLHIKSGSIQSA